MREAARQGGSFPCRVVVRPTLRVRDVRVAGAARSGRTLERGARGERAERATRYGWIGAAQTSLAPQPSQRLFFV